MGKSTATATWDGNLETGHGAMKPANASEIPFSKGTRFEGKKGSNPEEVIGAALAGCFSMALSLGLEKAGAQPNHIHTRATVTLEAKGGGFAITAVQLETEVKARGIEGDDFQKIAEETKRSCPVSKALSAIDDITLEATLLPG